MKICGIYKITNPIGKIYIGQSIDILLRWRSYNRYDCNGQVLLCRSLNKYKVEKHKFEIICQCDRNELDGLEKYYIQLFDTFNTKYGLNLQSGGNNGYIPSDETKEKLRNANLGKKASEEAKRKMGIAHKGNKTRLGAKLSDEQRARLKGSIPWNKGKVGIYSDETRRKWSISRLGNKNGLGNKLSEEAKEKIRQKAIGRKQTPETIEKRMSKIRGVKRKKK